MSTSGSQPVTPERLMRTMWDFAPPLILSAAVRVGVFDALGEGPRQIDEIAATTGASPRGLRSVLNALAGLGFLSKEGPERYRLTPESDAFLVSSRPGYLGGVLAHSVRIVETWLDLPEVVKSGKPASAVNEEQTGSEFFQGLVGPLFSLNLPAAQKLGVELGVASVERTYRVLDLAAGSGVWGIGIAQQSPHVTLTAVDWPAVLDTTRQFAERNGMAERFSYIGGDLAEVEFGTGYDLAILGHILHSEGEARSRELLGKTFHALAPRSRIAIAEYLVNDDRTGPPMGVIFGVNMLLNTAEGNTFSFREIRLWLEEAGFTAVREFDPGTGPATLVLAEKP
jgi:3-hydroxy-5-methyl-1-naphthoate 3-O-methyltransferase